MFVIDLEHLFGTSDALFPNLLHEVLVTDLAYESLDNTILRDVVELILPLGEAPDVAAQVSPFSRLQLASSHAEPGLVYAPSKWLVVPFFDGALFKVSESAKNIARYWTMKYGSEVSTDFIASR